MQWRGRRTSNNVEDRRGMGGLPVIGGGIGVVVVVLISLLTGMDPQALLQQGSPGGASVGIEDQMGTPPSDEGAQFVSVVLADTEDVWRSLFAQMGRQYREPRLVLFSGMVQSACGNASAAVGPFYCPGDAKVYIDLSFYDQLQRRFGAPGDFAQAYVIAHEIGHHVQNLLGITQKMESLRSRLSEEDYNRASVRLELQADFFAGVWAHHAQRTKQVLEPGDLEEALRAASAIGDDNIQKNTRGYVVPDSFTHGSSEQRVRWFRRGFTSGDVNQGDTFSVADREL